ncbi:hypothetical protein [Actinomadura sp. 6N118]|uniref:hypothetical protein n=1 Tax=Actinomadura sp. 6N118 TaxID=3375151 RepID=UPI0037A90B5D
MTTTTTTTAPAWPVRHLPKVERFLSLGSWTYLLTCPCGLDAVPHASRSMAQADVDAHVRQISAAVPADQRCRATKAHRMQPWERCGLCAGQIALDLVTGDPVNGQINGVVKP